MGCTTDGPSKRKIRQVVAKIPYGKVATYGNIAALAVVKDDKRQLLSEGVGFINDTQVDLENFRWKK